MMSVEALKKRIEIKEFKNSLKQTINVRRLKEGDVIYLIHTKSFMTYGNGLYNKLHESCEILLSYQQKKKYWELVNKI